MRIAFGIVSLFPGGGLQRDCLKLARLLSARAHDVTIFASRLKGEISPDLAIEVLPNRAWTNHGRNRKFATDFIRRTAQGFDRIVGFDKLLGLDVLYCADPSVAAKTDRRLRTLLPRQRALTALEAASFERGSATRILLLSSIQRDAYRAAWNTEQERMLLLPPNIDADRRRPQHRRDGTRLRWRAALGIDGEPLWLAVGVQPQVKGFDRVVTALAAHPAARLVIAGLDEGDKNGRTLLQSARRSGCDDRVKLLGFREDIPELMAAADVLVHPARYETTGTVLLEAIINGLPVITTAACGYAQHVEAAQAGTVMPEPFDADRFQRALRDADSREQSASWTANGVQYGGKPELYRGLDLAMQAILDKATAARCAQ